MAEPILQLDQVTYIYEPGTPYEMTAVRDVDLSLKAGEFVAILGHTGSGKSTLIQHLNGLVRPTSGTITFHGEDIYGEDYSLKELRSKVGLVFQYPEHQLFEATVFEDVCFGPKNLELTKEECAKRARQALQQVGLDESFYELSPFELSGGQKRRVAIAGVLAMEPEVLILDEPSAGLDPRGRDEILDQVQKLNREQGITIVLVSHSMDEVARYAERVIVMDHGQKLFDDTPRAVFAHAEKLQEIGLNIPQAAQIMRRLKEQGMDVRTDVLSVAEAKEEILRILRENR